MREPTTTTTTLSGRTRGGVLAVAVSRLALWLLTAPTWTKAFAPPTRTTTTRSSYYYHHRHHLCRSATTVGNPPTAPSSSGRATRWRLAAQSHNQPSRNLPDDDDDEKPNDNEEAENGSDNDVDPANNNIVNPYADPNYPDLEFVNYADPEYQADRGATDEYFASQANANGSNGGDTNEATEQEIEAMREDRRRRNDEYQFQTYYTSILREGDPFHGEWTVYKTDTFLPQNKMKKNTSEEAVSFPKLVKASRTIQVVSSSYKEVLPFSTTADGQQSPQQPVDVERIYHVERIASAQEQGDDPLLQAWKDDVDTDSGFRERRTTASSSSSATASQSPPPPPEAVETEREIMGKTYWPTALRALDFRGPQGIMVVGNAYTISTALDLQGNELAPDQTDGPFAEYRAELGLHVKDMRLRVKLDYAKLPTDQSPEPPLHLRSLTVCREGRNYWPRREGKFRSLAEKTAADGLFGATGADGGLYDPPPVGSDQQAAQYMVLDLEGHATVLFPFLLDQEEKGDQQGWVSSLDWAPGAMRYQVDRKVGAGRQLLGLRTLELSEVQTADAEQYRPKDGGQNMRQ